ncbi:hypothetical protein ABMA28_009708 [Loxostege sticticalis]|uniref:Uncharacterized protein n=1 Tax=Loxostege sticticalis TaxID=481309 RepID=A0ABD0SB60_LOXSC
MKFTKIFFVVFALMAALATVSASPFNLGQELRNFGKELEGVGQRVRDSIISARPAVDTVLEAQKAIRGGQ